jgi:NADH-ubiquinone oxidoreductase-G iron-sulfur binding region/NADH-quinone oxidoreductase subunit 3, ferredoxin-like domain
MCLVEVNSSQKLIIACATKLINNIKIYVKNRRIEKARESILEFLLINHPLDCPICDQGGECDLQDISEVFGSDKSRYYEKEKRSVIKKECGNLIEMEMTRCIHCTRCVRFLNEVEGNYKFGMLGRDFFNKKIGRKKKENIRKIQKCFYHKSNVLSMFSKNKIASSIKIIVKTSKKICEKRDRHPAQISTNVIDFVNKSRNVLARIYTHSYKIKIQHYDNK